MTRRMWRPLLILSIATSLAGCSTLPHATSASGSSAHPCFSQQDLARQARMYRQEAADLREMAGRRQAEADVLQRKENPDREAIKHRRGLAEDLLAAAAEAEQKAQDLERQVPHGMVQ